MPPGCASSGIASPLRTRRGNLRQRSDSRWLGNSSAVGAPLSGGDFTLAVSRAGHLTFAFGEGESLNSYIVTPVTASKWPAAFLEGHTSGPCRWLFSAARVRSEFSADT